MNPLMPRLEETVKALDTPATSGGTELRVVETRSESAYALAQMLRDALAQLSRDRSGGDPLGRVQVQGSPVGNRLLLAGPAEALDRVETLVKQLDNVPVAQGTRVFQLKHADARQVANLVLNTLGNYEARRRGGGGQIAAAAEDRSNTVVVSAPEAQLQLAEEIIQRLDEAGRAGGRQLQILPVQHNSAASIAAMVSQMFFPQVRTSDPNSRLALTAAPDDRALVIEAEESLLARIQETVEALDVEPTRGTVEVRTYALPEGRSGELAAALNRVFADPGDARRRWDQAAPPAPPAPRFEIDTVSELLIVAATADQFTRIEKVLGDLRSAAAMASQIRTFHLEHADPTQVVDVLQSMLLGDTSQRWRSSRGWRSGTGSGEVRVATAPALNAVVIQASPEKLAVATQLIRTLDRPQSESATATQTLRVQKAQPEAVALAVTQMLAAQGPPNTPRASPSPPSPAAAASCSAARNPRCAASAASSRSWTMTARAISSKRASSDSSTAMPATSPACSPSCSKGSPAPGPASPPASSARPSPSPPTNARIPSSSPARPITSASSSSSSPRSIRRPNTRIAGSSSTGSRTRAPSRSP
ncbi:MAG: hypothetical protein M5U12_31985 [Verrucomicrobia bacterium]|nr:hypothetical protein [Verrucomicrobiota bacterium]